MISDELMLRIIELTQPVHGSNAGVDQKPYPTVYEDLKELRSLAIEGLCDFVAKETSQRRDKK